MRAHILIVDDEELVHDLLGLVLRGDGHRVDHAGDGPEALELVETLEPDAIVLDVMMPGMDGFEVLDRLRAHPRLADVPIILLTARSTDTDIWHGWRSGVDSYVTKPFNPDVLVAEVRRVVLDGHASSAG